MLLQVRVHLIAAFIIVMGLIALIGLMFHRWRQGKGFNLRDS